MRSHSRRGDHARSIVLTQSTRRPSSSWIVAYCEFASGHDVRLHMPVRFIGWRQKVCVVVFALYEQWP